MSTAESPPNKVLIMAGGMTALFLAALDQTIVATALPKIVADLHGLSHLSWTFTAYMLSSTIAVPVAGKLSDLIGRRMVYLFAAVFFIGASILAAMSQDMIQLIIFRGLQGIGGGALMVNSFSIIGDLFPPAERGRWQGLMGAMFGLSSIAGPLLGGWITDNFSWRWIFYVNVPVGVAAVSVILYAFPRHLKKDRKPSIDYMGAAALAVFMVPLMLALVWGGSEYPWGSSTIMELLAAAVLGLGLFLWIESRAKEPVLPLDMFTNRTFLVSAGVTFLSSIGMFGTILYIPVFGQAVVGISATNSGFVLTPMMLGMVVASTISGQIVARTGRYRLLAFVGMIIATGGMVLFSQLTTETTALRLTLDMLVTGAGIGTTMPIFLVAVQNAFPHSKLGVVTASIPMFRSIGGTVGGALFGGLMNHRLADGLAQLSADPVVQQIKTAAPPGTFTGLTANAIQGVLSPQGQLGLKGLVAKAPAAAQPQLASGIDHLLDGIKLVFTDAVAHLFIAAIIATAAAALLALALPYIPLRKSNRPAMQEAAMEIGAEIGNVDARDEPDLTGSGPAEPGPSTAGQGARGRQ